MVRLNGAEYDFRPGMSLKELVDDYNADYCKLLDFNEFLVVINNTGLTAVQAQEKILSDNDKIFIVPMMDGG